MASECAVEIVRDTMDAALPPGVPSPLSMIVSARRVSPRTINADVILFDDKPAQVELTRWAFGWSYRYSDMPGGPFSFDDGKWRRVPEVGAAVACAASAKGGEDG